MSRDVRPGTRESDEAGMVLPGGNVVPQRPSGFAREVIETIVLTVIVFLVVRAAAQPYQIEGPSMQPGLHTGEYVLVSPIVYAFGGSPQRGDVIVFHPPTDPSEQFVKRVIGLPGDVVTISTNAITINGKTLSEPYVALQGHDLMQECAQELSNIKVAPNTYLVLGDNRANSEDSRCFGAVPRQNIIGKAELLFLPLNALQWINTYSATFSGIGAAPAK